MHIFVLSKYLVSPFPKSQGRNNSYFMFVIQKLKYITPWPYKYVSLPELFFQHVQTVFTKSIRKRFPYILNASWIFVLS